MIKHYFKRIEHVNEITIYIFDLIISTVYVFFLFGVCAN